MVISIPYVKMALWEDQVTDCYGLGSSLAHSFPLCLRLQRSLWKNSNFSRITAVHLKQHLQNKQTQYAVLRYALRKINM